MSAKLDPAPAPAVILAAEDDPNDALLLKRAFAKAGAPHCFIVVRDGQETIDYLEGKPPYDDRGRFPRPAFLLLDFHMPRVNALGVLEWLQTQPLDTRIPVFLCTSVISPSDLQTALRLGANSCITKPIAPADWLPLLQRVSQSAPISNTANPASSAS